MRFSELSEKLDRLKRGGGGVGGSGSWETFDGPASQDDNSAPRHSCNWH